MVETFCSYLVTVSNTDKVKKGIDMIMKFRNAIPEQFKGFTDPMFKSSLDKLSKAKSKEVQDYIDSVFK